MVLVRLVNLLAFLFCVFLIWFGVVEFRFLCLWIFLRWCLVGLVLVCYGFCGDGGLL